MNSSTLLHTLVVLPFVAFFISLVLPARRERPHGLLAFVAVSIHFAIAVSLILTWFIAGRKAINVKDITLYAHLDYEYYLDFYLDKVTAVYAITGALLTLLVIVYSRVYLHREEGYKRFFSTLLLFYAGYMLTVFAGNLETLFIGWEMLGICSFLLIAFYRERYLPVKNALRVFTIYRIGDIGLVLAMWASHHLWHRNVSFSELGLSHEHLETHSLVGFFIAFMILITAAGKSAQLPFSSWLARAMEGPTPSSAIFYGSLSVHIGAFLLLRTANYWENQLSVRIIIGVLGFLTSVICTMIARVQSSIKAQIAYSSSGQIGLIFLEIALGWNNLALLHFMGNAFLRTYQLLISPSVVSYLIRQQGYTYTPRHTTVEDTWSKRMQYSLYMMSLKEWNLDRFISRWIWNPLKFIGRRLSGLTMRGALLLFVPLYLAGLALLYSSESENAREIGGIPELFGLIGLALVLRAFTERKDVLLSWTLVLMNHFWIALAVAFNASFAFSQVHLYLGGIALAGILGYICLYRINKIEPGLDLSFNHGHVYEHRSLAAFFFLCCLGMAGFPITTTFIGEDLLYTHIREDQFVLALFTSISLVVDGLALVRIYSRVFLGPHIKSYHEKALRSS